MTKNKQRAKINIDKSLKVRIEVMPTMRTNSRQLIADENRMLPTLTTQNKIDVRKSKGPKIKETLYSA